ncbi:PREDICTED: spermatogenesis-associated protein 17 [Elephantulus edwardii]|uniref:spermatogenesis-associated protein 17 n=1 Tax=Elephantulus edwardii TaxID=28737 RepID=UPI0003F062EA|nr:PREDICTED: spermatogenesis-associated protein 17 [Elephantulus edwardii]
MRKPHYFRQVVMRSQSVGKDLMPGNVEEILLHPQTEKLARPMGNGNHNIKVKSLGLFYPNKWKDQIQRRWRGYRIRKYCFSYYYLKEYLRTVTKANDEMRERLEEFAEMKEREEKKEILEREKKERDYQARKTHYLLSTKQIPGIYNSPFRKEPDPWELLLQEAKPLSHKRPAAAQKHTIDLDNWIACTSARSFPRSDVLPPIHGKKYQGPFRDMAEVSQQRYKPLEPTLRVAEPIDELKKAQEAFKREQWIHNVNDKK